MEDGAINMLKCRALAAVRDDLTARDAYLCACAEARALEQRPGRPSQLRRRYQGRGEKGAGGNRHFDKTCAATSASYFDGDCRLCVHVPKTTRSYVAYIQERLQVLADLNGARRRRKREAVCVWKANETATEIDAPSINTRAKPP